MMWDYKAHLCGLSAQICVWWTLNLSRLAVSLTLTGLGVRDRYVLFSALNLPTSGVSGPDSCFEGELGALESHGNWPALSTGQGLCGAKGFSPPGHANSCALRPCHSGSEALSFSCIPMVSALNQSP